MVRGLFVAALFLALSCDGGGGASPNSAAGTAGIAGSAGNPSGTAGTVADGGGSAGSGGAHDAEAPRPLDPPRLVSPADGATDVALRTPLCWEPAASMPVALRYRVFVDDLELRSGVVGQEGFSGPCTEPLAFEAGRTFRWHAMAFDPAGRVASSPPSATFTFATEADTDTVVFEDDFERGAGEGWTIESDASKGDWVHGTPERTSVAGALAQPGECSDGTHCFFTASNPEQLPPSDDVGGGSVVLTSPSFNLSSAPSATLSLARYFFRSDATTSGARLQIELLTADTSAPSGYRATTLELLEGEDAQDQNSWTQRSFALCDAPLSADTRLRITASDFGDGIVEAAIDSVRVAAHRDAASCEERGTFALCDPAAQEPCGSGLVCCAQGTLNLGVHRCVEPARAIDEQDPQARDEPNAGEVGCPLPDLRVVADESSVRIRQETFAADSCALLEGCVGAPGSRRLLRFSMYTRNVGAADLVLGVPANRPDQYSYDACHDHYHFKGFANYQLIDEGGNVVAEGAKIAQCVWDSGSWAWPSARLGSFTCYNQGIAVGWEDEYAYDLDCQWIDITGVPAGDYTVRVAINAPTESMPPASSNATTPTTPPPSPSRSPEPPE